MKISAIIAIFLFLAIAQAIPPAAIRTTYSTDELVRLRCSQNPDEETYFFFNGTVNWYIGAGEVGNSSPPGNPNAGIRTIFNAVGINVAKCYKSAANPPQWFLVGREALWYLNTAAEPQIINTWTNINGETVNVVHVDNDPVMQTFDTVSRAGGPFAFPGQEYGNEAILPSDVTFPLNYANPLQTPPNATFAPYAPQKFYQAAELFNFISPLNEVRSTKDSVDSTIVTWTRTGQFLPWMKMGNTNGYLVYSFRGAKIPDYTYLPYFIKADIENRVPHYKHAPQSKCFPDMRGSVHSLTGGVTSWTLFKEKFDEYLNGVQFPLATPRSYGCRPEPNYAPVAPTVAPTAAPTVAPTAAPTCLVSVALRKVNEWSNGQQSYFQYNIEITNTGVKTIDANGLRVSFTNVNNIVQSFNVEPQGNNVFKLPLWNNLPPGASGNSGAYGVTFSPSAGQISVASVVCV